MSVKKGSKPKEIDKEDVKGLAYAHEDVLETKEAVLQRTIDLERAAAVGATNKQNVKIYFRTASLHKFKVVATIWAVTKDTVTLKGEVMIPIKAIYKVGLF